MISGCLPRYSISPCDNFLNYIDHEAFWNCSKRDKAYLVESSDEYIVIEPLPHGGYNVCKEKYIFLNSKRKKAISVPPYKIIFKEIIKFSPNSFLFIILPCFQNP